MFKLMHKRQWQSQKLQNGIVVVEAAIVLPLVLFIMLAVAEVGNALLQYNVLTRAVRDSARFTVEEAEGGTSGVIDLTTAKITAAKNLAAYGTTGSGTALLPGLSPANITVAIANTSNIAVSAQYQYQPLFAGNIPALVGDGTAGGTFTMNVHVIMRVL